MQKLRVMMISEAPLQDEVSNKNGLLSLTWTAWLKTLTLYASAIGDSGTTAQRPVKGLFIGRPYFDTDLGYIIHLKSVSPSVWVNGAGTTV